MSIYSQLGGRGFETNKPEIYSCTVNGRSVSFERVFRGYRFSDEECEALSRGKVIEVHGIHKGDVLYSVSGCLYDAHIPGGLSQSYNMKFKSLGTIPYDPDYKFILKDDRDEKRGSQDFGDVASIVEDVLSGRDVFGDAPVNGDISQTDLIGIPEQRRADKEDEGSVGNDYEDMISSEELQQYFMEQYEALPSHTPVFWIDSNTI